MLLARKGYRVLLVDRDSFPSDTMSSPYIWQPGVAKLKSWGLLDKVIASNCPPIPSITFDIGNAFLIRHTETNETPIESEESIDYLFHRLFAMVQFLLRNITP